MKALFHTFLYQPLFNALILLYLASGDLGIAIIGLTLVIRVLLFPLFYKMFRNQTLMQKIQPEIARLQELHKNDKELQVKAVMALYKEHNVNPFSSFLLIFIQLPILIALYRVFLYGFTDGALVDLYGFVTHPQIIGSTFLGLIDLKQKSIALVAIGAIAQYYQGILSLPRRTEGQDESMLRMSKTMIWVGPLLTILVLSSLPGAVALYWLTSSLFSIGQQWYINRKIYGERDGQHGGGDETTSGASRIS